ncbi:MAG: M3 family peptidase [Alphaproteobacteria bacterium]|nr:MAG: M3 family peptidase [Alphaproteobacteria bacterium]
MTNNNNPLLQTWDTPFGVPPFRDIEEDHFMPAFHAAMELHCQEIAVIADQQAAPTFENTIEALEKSGDTLSRVSAAFFNLSAAHTNEALQDIQVQVSPLLSRHYSTISLNATLFARIEALTEADLDLSAEQARVLERYHTGNIRAGAKLKGDDRDRIAAISERLAEIGTQFAQNMLADESDWEMVLEEGDLDGLPDFLRAQAANEAMARGHDGKFVITLSRSSIEPFLMSSARRDLRERAFTAWAKRGDNDDANDNKAVIAETMALRAEKAKLLGFANFADFRLDDQMAKEPARARDLLLQVWAPAKKIAASEKKKLQDMAQDDGENFDIAPWDWRYYAEKVRKAEFDIDASDVKPYLQLDQMIDAAFDTATKLFGLQFRSVDDVPTYHPDIQVWEVLDDKGDHLGLFMGDYFARSSKRSGAWMTGFREQENLTGRVRPIVCNVCNFAKGADGQPTLLSFDDARTLFHEFGHALHGLMSDVTYPTISGTNVARDYVELPSQLFEHWLSEPQILTQFALHHETGEPMPQDLLDRLQAAENFNQGFTTVEFVASALVDMELHLRDDFTDFDIGTAEQEILADIGMPAEIIMRHRSPHFGHIFAGDGYAAGYYSYMWSEVMDADAFQAFEETGDIFDKEIATRLKTEIYSSGGRQDPADAFRAFRGRDPKAEALLRKRGLDAV